MEIWRYSGIFLIITGVLHTLMCVFTGWDTLGSMIGEGAVNSVKDDLVRNMYFWFLVCGIVIIMFGQALHYYIRKEQSPAPRSLGCFMLVFSITGCAVVPVSGCSSRRRLLSFLQTGGNDAEQ